MSDEQDTKGSLRGRGRDIMRGPTGDSEGGTTGGGWLPSASENDEDTPYFEDDHALLKWMEVDPERNRPTFVPNKRLVETPKVDTGILYPDPDFDAIFADEEEDNPFTSDPAPSVPAPVASPAELPSRIFAAEPPQAQTLDDLFQSEDPVFDDIFGEATAPSKPTPPIPAYESLAVPDEYPLPSDEDFFMQADNVVYDDIPQEDLEGLMPSDHVEYVAEALPEEDAEIPTAYMELQPASDERLLPDEPTLPLAKQALPPLDEILRYGDPELEEWQDPHRPTSQLSELEQTSLAEPDFEPTIFADSDEIPPESPAAYAYDPSPTIPLPEDDEPDTAIGVRAEELQSTLDAVNEPDEDVSHLMAEELEGFFAEEESEFTNPVTTQELPALEPLPEVSAYEPPYLAESTPVTAEQEAFDESPYAAGPLPDSGIVFYKPYEPEAIPVEAEEEAFDELPYVADPLPESSAYEPTPMDADEATYGNATDILTQDFYGDSEIPSSHRPALELLDQMTGDIPSHEMGYGGDYWEDEPEPLRKDPSAENFVQMLEREAAESGQYDPYDYDQGDDVIDSIASNLGDLEEAVPIAESAARQVDLRNTNVRYSGFDKLNPREPEVLLGGQEQYIEPPAPPREAVEDLAEEIGGNTEDDVEEFEEPITRGAESSALATASIPALTPKVVRPSAETLFRPSELTPDRELVGLLVDDNRLRELFEQIEALHEDIVQNVRGDRGNSDVYQEELVYASNLLLSSRDNYDEARGIVYRIRADLNRERRVEEDIRKFRPTLILIYTLFAVALVILLFMGGFFSDVAEGLGAGWIAQGYYPVLAGMAGAIIGGFIMLGQSGNERTFDSLNVSQYLWKPLMGAASGFIAYLLALSPSASSLDSTLASEVAKSPVTITIALALGLFQDVAINALSNALGRVIPGRSTPEDTTPPSRNR